MQLLALLIWNTLVSLAAVTFAVAVELTACTSRAVATVLHYSMKAQYLSKVAALAVSLGAVNIVHAQSQSSDNFGFEVSSSDGRWTVLTMAPDGSWGAATESMSNRAIANAIAECKSMSRAVIGCGAYMTSIQRGWSLGIRCGNENIIVAARDLADAERAAIQREVELRSHYVPDMPRCRRVVTINPRGAIIVPDKRFISSK